MKEITHSEKQTEALGEKLARSLKPGDFIALYGQLGSGKTAFTRGLCRELKCIVDVSSPTFNIINIYPGKIEVSHIDLYRVDNDLHELGWDELDNSENITIIEWAEKAKNYLPQMRFDVYFTIIDLETREIEIENKQ
ncbi:MAG: tRNA (adenosine(37)-N6)-threonylcarbamoyltransferase complex ATPase subunit type 1 TsaE [candidate division Zixibacteria bacterium]|nr:tRNA (adenosine(37)-N6)-threonylcarbamoyltransferase complex ATPase subunit type 1 TsaE [candidate division Zixibacteria bacterium]